MSRRILTPTQSCVVRNSVSSKTRISPSNTRSFTCLPASGFTAANLTTRTEEDVTLCYVDPGNTRPSEYDLTACASALSGIDVKFKSATALPPSLELAFPQLPEIPDWFDCDDTQPSPPQTQASFPAIDLILATAAPADTPQSDYHSLEDYHPDAVCCVDVIAELERAAAEAQAQYERESSQSPASAARVPALGFPSPGFSVMAGKHKADRTVDALVHGHGGPRVAQHRRRSYSLDSADCRPAMMPPDAGLGLGLGSPFCPSQIRIVPSDSDAELGVHPIDLANLSELLSPAPAEFNLYASPASFRRTEALAVWRPSAPPPESDAESADQPFPSSASLCAVAHGALQSSVSWPVTSAAMRGYRREGGNEAKAKTLGTARVWTLEEQITLAVLAAMEARDKNTGGPGSGSGSEFQHTTMGAEAFGCSKSVGKEVGAVGRKGRVRRLLARLWRRQLEGVC